MMALLFLFIGEHHSLRRKITKRNELLKRATQIDPINTTQSDNNNNNSNSTSSSSSSSGSGGGGGSGNKQQIWVKSKGLLCDDVSASAKELEGGQEGGKEARQEASFV